MSRKTSEYYCNLRAIDSIGRCDVAVLVVDTVLGIHEQDLRSCEKSTICVRAFSCVGTSGPRRQDPYHV